MDKYVEIVLRPDPEFKATTLMNVIFAKFHKLLVELQMNDLGVSFPLAQFESKTLGSHMRLHGTGESLGKLMTTDWLKAMRDHVVISRVQSIPDLVTYVAVRRVQVKSNPERLRRRYAKRKGISIEEARECIPDISRKTTSLPFLNIRSTSTGQLFRLFISQKEVVESSRDGDFNCFGISRSATLPWF